MSNVFIGMAAYNAEKHIGKAIDSLLNQSYLNFKLFISDDASTDTTSQICLDYAKKDARVIYYRQKQNLGMLPNLKFVLDKADEVFFTWVDADDIREKDFLKVCVAALIKKNVDAAITVIADIDSYDRNLREPTNITDFSGKPSSRQVAKYVLQPEVFGKSNLMYSVFKTEIVKRIWELAPQRNEWGSDYHFGLALVSHYSVYVDKRILIKKRTGGISSIDATKNDVPENVIRIKLKNPKNHMFPLIRFKQYFIGQMSSLRGTPYGPLVAFLLFTRLPRAIFIYMKERNYTKFFMKLIKFFLKTTFILPVLHKIKFIRMQSNNEKRHGEKQDVLLYYKNKYSLDTLIETGTYQGDMVAAMAKHFNSIYSTELSVPLYERAKNRFRNNNKIHLFQGDSSDVLPVIVKSIRKPCLFWLDAHYSRGETACGSIETPIMRELQEILRHSVKNHIILIDDARCFNGTQDYPTIEEVKKLLEETNHGYILAVESDIIRIYPRA
ncbi:MAG: glycosyltransferase [bacterium]|nr:glycosyltransferase [bacterium]